ncbi:mitochondrial large subunit ribosomal protein-domain-containing protein [Cladorrhinum samala]|uniref:Large ribosomal subunit protein mL49 n=1 Tax=Cladorrhinum samala TaxID=585594 RepID=A0AAV9HZF0_9PEZI|nr:mitochondrial large subunit ribosomal protein-domain-containing protein [Cladorrhinum samala]
MLRPATLTRAGIAPTRCLLQTPSRTSILARRFLTTETTAAASSEAPSVSQTAQAKQPRPFLVGRTPSTNFAVYQRAKRGGNKFLTVIKKVEGDRAKFKESLAAGLGINLSDVTVNNLTGHVVVAGHRKPQIEEWLKKEGL